MLCLHTSDNVFKMRFKVSSCLQALITASISHLLLESSRQRSIKTQQGFNWKSSEIYFWWLLFLKAGQLYRSKIVYHRQINFFVFNICEWRNIAVMTWEVNKCHHLVNQPCFWLPSFCMTCGTANSCNNNSNKECYSELLSSQSPPLKILGILKVPIFRSKEVFQPEVLWSMW